MKILIAEDHPDGRNALKMLLEVRGHTVDVAQNGQEAVNVAVESPPDVIVMDLQMPVMDGITATRMLRARRDTQAIPIIGLSAYLCEPGWQKAAFEAGCSECLPKPLEWRKFEEVLGRLQEQARKD